MKPPLCDKLACPVSVEVDDVRDCVERRRISDLQAGTWSCPRSCGYLEFRGGGRGVLGVAAGRGGIRIRTAYGRCDGIHRDSNGLLSSSNHL